MNFAQAVKELDLRDPFTQKPLTPKELMDIFKEDVVLALERPGSWEGSNMLIVLTCHGLFFDQSPCK